MPVDHYAPCPCGSGKKLKFCKCVDQPQEYEKIVKLIEGGQGLAAVDRINSILQKTPNTAWLLAIKGELTLSMKELESFKETAIRFLKLKPDNPLALVMRSMVASLDGEPVENSARYLLQGMSEARESFPALTLPAIRLLISSLEATDKTSFVGYWSEVLSALTSGESEQGDQVDPNLNLLAKSPARIIEDRKGSPWKERLAEVLSLARTFRYAQAETKLRSILRDFPDQPGPLSHLLRAQCAQLDQHGAVSSAKKLAALPGLSEEERGYFAAIALEFEPDRKSLQSEMIVKYCEVDSEERISAALDGLDFVDSAEGEGVEQVRRYYAALVQDEVPARRIYSVFDKRVKPDRSQETSGERTIASSAGTVVIYGKQTDKPTRALFIANRFAAYQDVIDQVLNVLQLGAEMTGIEIPTGGIYSEFLRRPKLIVDASNEVLSIEEQGRELIEDFLNLPQTILKGATPLEAAKDESQRDKLRSLLFHLEGEQTIVVAAPVLDELYQRLGVVRPSGTVDPKTDSLRLSSVLDMDRVDVSAINDSQLKGLSVRSMSLGASRVFYRCAEAVRSRSSLVNDLRLQMLTLSGLLSIAPSIEMRIEVCRELELVLVQAKAPVGRIIIQHMSLLHALGRSEEAQRVLLEAAQKYPQDPHLMSFIQYAMQSQGGGGGMRGGPADSDELAKRMMQNASRQSAGHASPSDEGSGLILPGSASSGPQGESKLWLPGS